VIFAPAWRRLDLSERHNIWCLVDADDYDWIIEHHWNYGWHVNTPLKHYAKRNVGAARSTVYLHREILIRADASTGTPHDAAFYAAHHGDHRNGQSLDNRKANLRWLTPAQNRANRIEWEKVPTLDQIVARLARRQAVPAPEFADIPF
jgi:hypothetical protein